MNKLQIEIAKLAVELDDHVEAGQIICRRARETFELLSTKVLFTVEPVRVTPDGAAAMQAVVEGLAVLAEAGIARQQRMLTILCVVSDTLAGNRPPIDADAAAPLADPK